MINEERVVLMTKLAAYEKGEGKRNKEIVKYFRGDYISLHLLKTVISGTFAFIIAFGVYLLYYYEELLENLYNIDYAMFAQKAVTYYLVFIAVYGILTYIVFTCRFFKAKIGIKRYYQNLKKLNAMYRQ